MRNEILFNNCIKVTIVTFLRMNKHRDTQWRTKLCIETINV